MKAAVFRGPKGITLEDLPTPKVGSGDLLIKVKATGICGTDEHILRGEAHSAVPVVLGHEYAGEVVEVGREVSRFKPGDRVTVDPNIVCGRCEYCSAGKVNLCRNLKALGVDLNGGFAEYSLVPEEQAYRLPDHVSYEEAALVEPLACSVHGIELLCLSGVGQAVVLGGGTIGLMVVQLLKLEGVKEIVLSEPVASKRELALKLGAHRGVNPLEENIDSQAADLVVECAGLPLTVSAAFDLVRNGGTILLFGLVGSDVEVKIRPQEIVTRELKIQGSVLNPYTHEKALRLIAERKVSVRPLITHRFRLQEIELAFNKHQEHNAVKILLTSE